MSVNNYFGKILTNRYAGSQSGLGTNPILNDSYYANGSDDIDMDLVQAQVADSIGSTYKLLTVPSNSRIHKLEMANEALGTGCTASVGVYYPAFLPSNIPLSGTVINATFFAAGVAVATAHDWASVLNSGGSNTLPLQQQNLWQALGLAQDPICDLDIVVTLSGAAVGTAGNIALKSENCI